MEKELVKNCFFFKLEVPLFLTLFSFCWQDKIDNDYKEDFKVLSNQSCQEKCLDNAFNHEHLKEIDRCDKIIEHSNSQDSSNTKDFVQNLNKLDSSEKRTEDVAKKVPLITKASPVKLFAENTDVDKVIIFELK